jgi:bzd-type benzoyl-CoA reductase N subunit
MATGTISSGLQKLERFREVNRTFPATAQIRERKQRGDRVFGWLCTYVPEELLHAAGILPVRITGYDRETDLDDGNAHLYTNSCSFSRSCLQMGLAGEYGFLDGVVGASTCDGARRLFDVWRSYIGTPFHHVISVPRKYSEEAVRLYHREIVRFQEHLEEFLGEKTADEALRASIDLYNESRRLLHALYEFRTRDNPPITGAEVMEVSNASYRMPKEAFNEWLRELLTELEASSVRHRYRARLMVVGSVLTNPEFIASIENEGGLVVTDELCTSTRYWGDLVYPERFASLQEALAHRYLNNFPCARMYPSDERFNRIIDYVKKFRADGVVSQIIRYCVPYAHDLPLLTKRLAAVGTPVLGLDLEYGTSGSGQIATRVQAFLEMIEARRK